jgi:formylglycine-generating enzyme required for sulfatase activity
MKLSLNYDKDSARVLRGGGWSYDPSFARVAHRDRYSPGARLNTLGFRLYGGTR